MFALLATTPPSALQSIVLPILAAVFVVGTTMAVTWWIRRRIAIRDAARPSTRERMERLHANAAASDRIDASVAGAVDTVQRLSAQLDARSVRLEQLIREADERIAQLEAASDATAAGPPPNAAPPVFEDPLVQRVHALHDTGQTPVEIARGLGETTGKVELIIALRRGGGDVWAEGPHVG